MKPSGFLTRVFIWLSGASEENMRTSPSWERRKYVAFGATVLVPCVFALIASSYAIHTLTTNPFIIVPVALAWGFIILTIDRALLATYRAYQSTLRKIGQFSLRVVVATLMGITISHPLTLLLFRDTISSVIEKDREAEMVAVRTVAEEKKKVLEDKIGVMNEKIASLQEQWGATFAAGFRSEEDISRDPLGVVEQAVASELDKLIIDAQARPLGKIQEVEKEIAALTEQSTKLQGELDFWQKEFERELNGQRSGIVGLGPRAKGIQTDQLDWRRAENKRLSGLLQKKRKEVNKFQAEATDIERQVRNQYQSEVAEQAQREREERDRLAGLNRLVQGQQISQFVEHQNQSRLLFKTQIDTLLEQSRQAQLEVVELGNNEHARLEVIRTEPRRDLLRQTLALRHLFHDGDAGGSFALTTYLVLSLLFMLIDTIPLVLKFFSKPGPYDTIMDCDEVRYDREREAFIKNYVPTGGGSVLQEPARAQGSVIHRL